MGGAQFLPGSRPGPETGAEKRGLDGVQRNEKSAKLGEHADFKVKTVTIATATPRRRSLHHERLPHHAVYAAGAQHAFGAP